MANVNKTVDVAALDLLCDKLECGDANHRATAAQIRKAMNGVERSNDGVDVDALLKLADEIEEEADLMADEVQEGWANTIRKAVKGVPSWSSLKGILAENKSQLPEGIIWPRFTDGELVKFGDVTGEEKLKGGDVDSVTVERNGAFCLESGKRFAWYCSGDTVKRPDPEVLDADGVPVKVGDTVWSVATGEEIKICSLDPNEIINVGGADGFWYESLCLTHRKPDTLESVVTEMLAEWDENNEEFLDMDSYFARFRKLMGGE